MEAVVDVKGDVLTVAAEVSRSEYDRYRKDCVLIAEFVGKEDCSWDEVDVEVRFLLE